jgi:hypothetical protein
MLRNFAAALLATTLIAGPAFAAQPSGTTGATPATASAPASTKAQAVTKETKPVKMVKHVRSHVRKHFARNKVGTMKVASHVKTHRSHIARSHVARNHFAHAVKPGKVTKSTKSAA